jgi:VWFA-related protein
VPVPVVIEDVVIRDRDDHPVRGLKASDLTVTEDGKRVTLQYFQEHSPAPGPAPAPKLPDLGPNVFGNMIATPATDSLNILLLDALNTPLTDQALMRQQMIDYLKTLPPGLSIAVFGLNSQLYMLQEFTTDPKVLLVAIEQNKKTVEASPLLDHPGSDAPEQKMSDFIAQGLDISDPGVALMLANIQQFERQVEIGQTELRVQYTLQALNQLGRYLSGLPGRKNVIWFSGSFPLNFIPDPTLPQPIIALADFQDDVRKTTDLLARSQVAVYPVDGRGLLTPAALDASQSGQTMARIAAGSGKAPTVGPRSL